MRLLCTNFDVNCIHRARCTLDALGQISEVEDVVRLGGRGQQVGAHAEVDFDGGVDDRVGTLTHLVRELVEETGQQRLQQYSSSISSCQLLPLGDITSA